MPVLMDEGNEDDEEVFVLDDLDVDDEEETNNDGTNGHEQDKDGASIDDLDDDY